MASKRMSAALSVLKTRNFSKMFLRARRLLEFSHGLGHKQMPRHRLGKSALPLKADIACLPRYVRFVPGADSCPARKKDDAPFRLRASLM